MTAENRVIVLFDGYSENGVDGVMNANCTTTLIRGKQTLTIVDTRTAWDGEALVAGSNANLSTRFRFRKPPPMNLYFFSAELAKHSIRPNEITHVVCTHGHSDHIGCNYLFLDAKVHIVGKSISNRCEYSLHSFEMSDYRIDDGICVTMTPGHTMDSVSVVVEHSNLGVVAICGDLFERFEDVADENIWMDAGSEDRCLQQMHRLRMADLADVIIPGHGPIFSVTDHMKSRCVEHNC